jgi:putative spermidine/putrescine transport system ATP-binding protein/putrescine transport system ATP-binding protein
MTLAVEFEAVHKRFGETLALDGISFSVESGETISLLGPSGCGKSTLLRLIAGFERPDSGIIKINGQSMAGLKPYERNVGLLFQHYALFPHMTVEQNIAYGLKHRRYPSVAVSERVAEMLSLVQLVGFGDRRPQQLSGGQQQRVALARALATRPSLLLLDEPLSALDAKLRHELRSELKEVLAAVGSTAIVVTHDHEEAMSLGERVFIMNAGTILQSGTPDDVYWRPATRFVADFMGRANWLKGNVLKGEGGAAIFRSEAGWTVPVSSNHRMTDAAEICIRPESIELSLSTDDGAPDGGRIVDIVKLGSSRHVFVEIKGGDCVFASCANQPHSRFEIGQPVKVTLSHSASNIFDLQG